MKCTEEEVLTDVMAAVADITLFIGVPHWSSSGAISDNEARPLSKCPFRIILHSSSNQNEINLNVHAAQKKEDKLNKEGREMRVNPVQPFWSMVVHTSEHITAGARALHVRVWRVPKKKVEMKGWFAIHPNWRGISFPSCLPPLVTWCRRADAKANDCVH